MGEAFELLAHAGSASTNETGKLIFTIMLLTVLGVVWIVLGIVCWIFWRAKKREEAEGATVMPGGAL